MNLRRSRTTRAAVVLVLATGALGSLAGGASAATTTINLCALPGTATPLPTTAPTVTADIWGFALAPASGDCTGLAASLPGPTLTVAKGDTVTLHVVNQLPNGHHLSLAVPGISFAASSNDAAPGATLDRTFVASRPGTFLYQGSGDAGRQAAMGLAGALIVQSATAGQAYDAATTAYDVDAPMVLGALDPAFNAAENAAATPADEPNMLDYKATYWLINGLAYPDTAPVAAAPGQRVLFRYLNAGYDNSSMQLGGLRESVVARDGYLLNNAIDAVSETIPAGGTEDAIAAVPTGAPPSSHGFPVFNRQLHLTNGPATFPGTPNPVPNPYHTPGGMMTFVQVP